MTVIAMSRTEIDRMSVLHDLADGRIKVTDAATVMSLGRRQVFRLAAKYERCRLSISRWFFSYHWIEASARSRIRDVQSSAFLFAHFQTALSRTNTLGLL